MNHIIDNFWKGMIYNLKINICFQFFNYKFAIIIQKISNFKIIQSNFQIFQ